LGYTTIEFGVLMSRDYKCTNHKILSTAEEYKLFEEYSQTKSLAIRDKIIAHNLKFAMGSALLYLRRYKHVDPNDLKGYAVMGLIDAFEKFDHTRGLRFTSYASWWVKCSINRNVADNESIVRYPNNIHQEVYNHYKNHKGDSDELDAGDYSVISSNMAGGISIDQPIENTDLKIEDVLVSPDTTDALISDSLEQALTLLPPQERHIIESIYGFSTGERQSIREIAAELDISHENVRIIRNKALAKLKKYAVKADLY
jgi:RNA polymerase primary sigma factor